MPTYITPDLVPPVLALPTGSHRGTWALADPLGGHAHPPLPAPRAHPSANVATHTRTTPAWPPPPCVVGLPCRATARLRFSHPSKRRPRSGGSRLPGECPIFPVALRRKLLRDGDSGRSSSRTRLPYPALGGHGFAPCCLELQTCQRDVAAVAAAFCAPPSAIRSCTINRLTRSAYATQRNAIVLTKL